MGITNLGGPLVINGPSANNTPGNQSVLPIVPESGPSLVFGSIALFDPRYAYKGGAGTENNPLICMGLGPMGGFTVLDQAPSTAAVNNIAVAAAVTTGTAMTLVSTSGAGITVTTTATKILQTGNTVPSGALAIDVVPAPLYFGANKTIAVADPTKNIARTISVTGVTGASGGAIIVSGYDLYGYAQTEKITANASSVTANGKKAFKFITAVTSQFADTHSYSIGTADIFGFPMRVDTFPYVDVGWNGSLIAASTGFVKADTTSPASNTTGDVRGTYAVQSASNGVITLQNFVTVSPANISTIAGMFGVTPA